MVTDKNILNLNVYRNVTRWFPFFMLCYRMCAETMALINLF